VSRDTQPELLLAMKMTEADRAAALLPDLIADLKRQTGWITRAELKSLGWNDRDVRLARQYSKGRIIFGQKGFMLAERAPLDDIEHCARDLQSRAMKMLAESRDVFTKMHTQKHARSALNGTEFSRHESQRTPVSLGATGSAQREQTRKEDTHDRRD